MTAPQVFIGFIIVISLIGASLLRWVTDGEALLVFRFERPHRSVGPGIRCVLPFVERAEHCSTRARRYLIEIECMSQDLMPFRARVALMWRLVDPVAYQPIDEIHRTRILTLLEEAVADVATDYPLARAARGSAAFGSAVIRRLEPRLCAVGIGLVDLVVSTPELPLAMTSAWSREPVALAERAGRVAEADTEAMVARKQLSTFVEELVALEWTGRRLGVPADRLYERRTRREASSSGATVVVMSPPPSSDEADRTPVVPIVFEHKRPA